MLTLLVVLPFVVNWIIAGHFVWRKFYTTVGANMV